MENSKYLKGKIYKIFSYSTENVYIGSSCQQYLSNRLQGHRAAYKLDKDNPSKYISSFEIVKYPDSKIILVESYPCNNKDELRAREQHWIDNTPNCVNKVKAFITEDQRIQSKKAYVEKNKEKITKYKHDYYKNKSQTEEFKLKAKNYKEDHKEYYQNYGKKYREKNYESLQQQKKKYNLSHKDQLSQKRREHYELNKSKIKADNSIKYYCEFCNTTLTKCKKSRHVKCKKHIQGVIKDMQEFRNLVEIHRQTRLAKNEANRRLLA